MAVKEIKLLLSNDAIKGNGKTEPVRPVYRLYNHNGELIVQLPCSFEFTEKDLIIPSNLKYILEKTLDFEK